MNYYQLYLLFQLLYDSLKQEHYAHIALKRYALSNYFINFLDFEFSFLSEIARILSLLNSLCDSFLFSFLDDNWLLESFLCNSLLWFDFITAFFCSIIRFVGEIFSIISFFILNSDGSIAFLTIGSTFILCLSWLSFPLCSELSLVSFSLIKSGVCFILIFASGE